ncbi:MAG: toll/interleukin-1 receptor domain-containing protein [Candidatus Acidiferrales bacterium]
MAHDVFISHSSKDKTVADAVCTTLEQHKIRCWIAPRDIEPGQEWGESIIDAIQGSLVMILIFSASANDSPQIRREVERAVNKSVIIVPLRIEDVALTKSLRYFIASVYLLDALTPPLESHLEPRAGVVGGILMRRGEAGAKKIMPLVESLAAAISAEPVVAPPKVEAAAPPGLPAPVPSEAPIRREAPLSRVVTAPVEEASRKRLGLYAALGILSVLLPLVLVSCFKPSPFNLDRTLSGHTASVRAVSFSPDARWLASGSVDQTIKLWDVATGQEVRTLSGHTGSVWSVAFSPDGRWLASGSTDQTVKLWDVTTGQELRTLSGHANYVTSVAFSPTGHCLASGSWDNTVKLWDVATGQELRTLSGHANYVNSVAFSPDGRWLASGSRDKMIKLWDAATGKELGALFEPTETVFSVAFSPDGRWLASCGEIKLWNLATGKVLRTFSGHTALSLAFSPDGRWLASGSGDKTIKLLDVATGKVLRTFSGHTDWVHSVAFSPDGRWLASGSADNTIKLWRRKE